jgi:hypothetical protein
MTDYCSLNVHGALLLIPGTQTQHFEVFIIVYLIKRDKRQMLSGGDAIMDRRTALANRTDLKGELQRKSA